MGDNKVLTDKGFVHKTYNDLLNVQIDRAKELFGADIDTSEVTPLGKFMRLAIYDIADVYEALEIAYYARFPNTASGQSLDKLMPFAGISRNPATFARHKITLTGTKGFTVEAGFLVGTQSGICFYVTDETILDSVTGTADAVAECTVRGEAGNVIVGEITDIVNPSADVLSVTHISVVSLGEKAESDYELRRRFSSSVSGAGSATSDSIIGAIMRIQGVSGVLIDENDTDETSASGVPRRSFETLVLGNKDLKQQIADTIFSKKPLGIKTYGKEQVEVIDKGGFSHVIKFSWTSEITVYIKIKIQVNTFFESTGVEQIKGNIYRYLESLSNGQSVILTSLYGHIYSVSGVTDVQVLSMSTDGEVYSTDDILCKINEVAVLSMENIFVEVCRNGV